MPNNYSTVTYANPFLAQVIIRADFLGFIGSDFLFQETKINAIRTVFPHVTMRQVMRFNNVSVVLQNGGQPQTQALTQEGFQQLFLDQYGNKLIISNKFLVLEINHYTTFEETIAKLETSWRAVLGDNQIDVCRLGIRYINRFDGGRIRLAKGFFNSEIRALFNPVVGEDTKPRKSVRSMCLNEYRINDMRLNFRYGMYNPHYPNVMRENSFTLDYDCFCDSVISGFEAILAHIIRGHDEIQELFETSITDTLREKMNSDA